MDLGILTESCNCNPNYFGESCDKLCVNGVFTDGDCNCLEGYEGLTCEAKIGDRFLGWWTCVQWTFTSPTGGPPIDGFTPGSIKFEEGHSINQVELFPTESSDGLMLLRSDSRIVGKVTENTMSFLTGSASFGNDRILTIELFFVNTNTSFT